MTINTGGASNIVREKVNGSTTGYKTIIRRPITLPSPPIHQRNKILSLQARETRRS